MDPPTSADGAWLLSFFTQFTAAGFGALLGASAAFYFAHRDDWRRQRGRALVLLADLGRVDSQLRNAVEQLGAPKGAELIPVVEGLAPWSQAAFEHLAVAAPDSAEPLVALQHHLLAAHRNTLEARKQEELNIDAMRAELLAKTQTERDLRVIAAEHALRTRAIALDLVRTHVAQAQEPLVKSKSTLERFLETEHGIDRLLQQAK